MHICFFDIDGTLIDTGGAGRDAMLATLAAEFDTQVRPDGVTFAGRTDRAIVRDLFGLHAIEDNVDNWNRFQITFVKHLEHYLPLRHGRVLPGVVELLELLAGRTDVVLGLLTGNLRAGARLKLSHYGLYKYFAAHAMQCGAFGDEYCDRDQLATCALNSLSDHFPEQIDAKRVWVIGDTPLDIRCARAIGAQSIAVATGIHSRVELAAMGPDLLFADLSDASPFLALLER